MLPRQLLQIDYDQFQRYAAITVLLKPLLYSWQKEGRTLRILEVGSHALNLLPAFLSPFSIEIVRADLEPQYAGDVGPYVTIEKDQPLPFADEAFDVVVAMEVLEHIPPQSRCQAVSEWTRVAGKGIFFTCPNGELVIDQERRADADFTARHGRVHPWHEEHERYGRPTLDEVQTLLKQLSLSCHRFNNSPLVEWLPLLLVSEQIFEQGDPELFARFNEMLNTRPFQPCIQEPAYRSIYAAFKSPGIDQQAQSTWLGNRAVRNTECADKTDALDPTRLLAGRLSQFIIKHRRHEVDAAKFDELVNANADLKHKLACMEQALSWMLKELKTDQSNRVNKLDNPLNQAQLNDLERVRPHHWHIVGSRPSFEWACYHERGWHRIELMGQVAPGHNSILLLDYGQGICEEHRVRLGSWRAGPDRLCVNAYFHHPVTKIRLLPCRQQSQTVVIIEQVAIQPLSTARVALEGMGRLCSDLVRFPRLTWRAMLRSRSWLRLGMQQTMRPRGLPIGAKSDYQRWLLENRPTPSQRRKLTSRHRDNTSKFVVFLRLKSEESMARLTSTLQSLLQQDEYRWEVWCAAEPGYQQHLQTNEIVEQLGSRLHWVNDGSDRGLAGVLNQCVKESQADWLLHLQVGDVLEPDACLQFLEAARTNPQAALVIADEGHLDPVEGETEPVFKPLLKPEMLRRQPLFLGEAFAIHAPTLMRLGGFHAGYEGALAIEYLYRLLHSEQQIAQKSRVLMHYPARQPISKSVLKVIARIQEEYASSEYRITYDKVAQPSDSWQRGALVDAAQPVKTRRDGASC